MKILWFNHRDTKHPEAGGAELYLMELAKRIVKQGHSIDVFCERPDGFSEIDTIEGVNIIRRGNRVTVHLNALLYGILHRDNYDAIIDDMGHSIPWLSPIYSKKSIGIIHHVHDKLIFKELSFPLSFIAYIMEKSIPWFYRNSRIVTVSNSTLNNLVNIGIKKSKIQIVFPGIDRAIFDIKHQKSETPCILYLGRLRKYKNINQLIAIHERINSEISTQLIIAGEGEAKNEIQACISQSNARDMIQFKGYVTNEEKFKLMKQAWVFLSASEKEGWGSSCFEAAACGTPTVAFNVPGLRDSIINGETGILVEYGDIDSLGDSVKELIMDYELRQTLSENAVKWTKKHTWEESSEQLLSILERNCM